ARAGPGGGRGGARGGAGGGPAGRGGGRAGAPPRGGPARGPPPPAPPPRRGGPPASRWASASASVATAARRLALRVLLDVERGGPTLGDRLASGDVETLSERDRAFLHELVLGALRRRGALGFPCAPRLARPLGGLDPTVQ